MKISALIDYTATPQDVFAMLADEEFQNRKCKATGALHHTVSITTKDDGAIIVTDRHLPSVHFPHFVKGMVGESLHVTETQDWGPSRPDGTRHGTLTVEIAGAPVHLHGTLTLEPGGPGSVEIIEANLKASIPFLGGRVEEAAAPAVRSAIRVEGEVGQAWLAARK